jgi:hypothetical protein
MSEIIPLNGHVRVRAWEKKEDGTEKQIYDRTIKNLIVTVGKESLLKYIGNLGGGYANSIGVGDSTTAAASGQTDLQASTNKLWKTIVSTDRVYLSETLYLSSDFGYTEANFTWNELGLRDNQGTPVLIARQIDSTPLIKTSSKRSIVEWQLSL